MSAAQNPQVELLLRKSAEDERTLSFPVDSAVFQFHTQQALEKLLKALISAHGSRFPHVHDIKLLTDQLEKLGEKLPTFSLPLSSFTTYGVLVRYDDSRALSDEERFAFREVVAELRDFVVQRVDAIA